jgi:hypothetical protein
MGRGPPAGPNILQLKKLYLLYEFEGMLIKVQFFFNCLVNQKTFITTLDARIYNLSPTVAIGCCDSSEPPQNLYKTVANC